MDLDAGIRRLVAEAPSGAVFRRVESRWEKALLRRILERTEGNPLQASDLQGIPRVTVRRTMDRYGL